MTGRRGVIALLAAAAGSLGWLDPSATPRAAARLYAEGKFDDAATKYNQALTDSSGEVTFNFSCPGGSQATVQVTGVISDYAVVVPITDTVTIS